MCRLILESDSLVIVKEMLNQSTSYSALVHLLYETKLLLGSYIDHKIQYVSRLRKEVAHRLARHVWNVANVEMWWGDVPFLSLK